MKILIIGVSGLIGRQLYSTLSQEGHDVVGCSRKRVAFIKWQLLNFKQSLHEWESQLQEVELVINAVGIFKQSKQQSFAAIHESGPKILFEACQNLNVKVMQISAIGAEKDNPLNEFLQSKRKADQYLLKQKQANIILYPGIVLGEQGRSTRQLSVLALMNCMPLVFGRHKELPVVSLQQLMSTIIKLIESWPSKSLSISLLAKPETMENLLNNLRCWMGMKNGRFIYIPKMLVNSFFFLFPTLSMGAFNKQSFAMASEYQYDNNLEKQMTITVHTKNKVASLLGQTASESLLNDQATERFRKEMKNRLLFYINLIVLGVIWILSGLSSLINIEQSRELISIIGVSELLGDWIIYVAAMGDIFLGIILWGCLLNTRFIRKVVYLQIGVMLIYSLIISIAAPIFWLHPFAPVVKNLAMIVLSLYLLTEKIEKE